MRSYDEYKKVKETSDYKSIEETLRERLTRLCDEMKDDIDHFVDWYINRLEQSMTLLTIKDLLDEVPKFNLTLCEEGKLFALHKVCESDYMK